MNPLQLTCLALCVATLAIVARLDTDDARQAERHYCEMVAIWQEHSDVPEPQRPGWPPYRDDVECR